MLEVQKEIHEDSVQWFPAKSVDLIYNVLSMCGEAGEVANILKKVERGSLEWNDDTRVELAMELADVYIYLLQCANIIGVDLVAAYKEKRKINVERFGTDAGTESGVRQSDAGEETERQTLRLLVPGSGDVHDERSS